MIFPYNSLYTQTVVYTTYFQLAEPVLRREKYCVSTKLGVSNAYLRTRVSTQFRVKLRGGRVFGEAVDFTDRLSFFSCDLFTHFLIFTSRFFEEIVCMKSGEAEAASVLHERESKAEEPFQFLMSFNGSTGK